MISVKSNLLYARGKKLPAPTLEALEREYFHAVTIKVIATESAEPDEDIGKVIILRPSVKSLYEPNRVENPMFRGYFAYGKRDNGNVVFNIYTPHPSVRFKFPPKSLETAVGLFALKLLQGGYSINSKAVEFTTHINGQE